MVKLLFFQNTFSGANKFGYKIVSAMFDRISIGEIKRLLAGRGTNAPVSFPGTKASQPLNCYFSFIFSSSFGYLLLRVYPLATCIAHNGEWQHTKNVRKRKVEGKL